MSSETESGRDKAHQATCPSCGAELARPSENGAGDRKPIAYRTLRILDSDQVLALMKAAPLALQKLIILTFVGARFREAVDFQPAEQIDRARGEITILSGKDGGRRVLSVDPQLIAILCSPSTPSKIDPKTLLRKAGEEAGLGPVTFGELRGSFIALMLRYGVASKDIVRAVGGAGASSMVDRIYGDLLPVIDLRGRIPVPEPVSRSAQPEMLRQASS